MRCDQYYFFLKNAEIVCSVDKYQLPLRNTYNNALNVNRDLRSVYTERDRERGLAAFAKEWSK